ncbi:hypothetical protein COOONC_24749 [Cooperia oncophora]
MEMSCPRGMVKAARVPPAVPPRLTMDVTTPTDEGWILEDKSVIGWASGAYQEWDLKWTSNLWLAAAVMPITLGTPMKTVMLQCRSVFAVKTSWSLQKMGKSCVYYRIRGKPRLFKGIGYRNSVDEDFFYASQMPSGHLWTL